MSNKKNIGMNEIIIGIICSVIGLLLTIYGGLKVNDGWKNINEKTEKINKTTFNVKSENQNGGVTVGQVQNLNIVSDNKSDIEQQKKDSQLALIYQTEINHFFTNFKICLHWSLPLGSDVDKEIDAAFNYGRDFSEGIDFDRVTNALIMRIFTDYEFRNVMPNYVGKQDLKPTGFNNLLGILEYFDKQIEKNLGKYASNVSTELTTKIEYTQRTTQSTISNLRLDLKSLDKTNNQTAKSIADLLIQLKEDYFFMKENYTKNISGGYPISIGKVSKVDDKEGQMIVQAHFSSY